MVVLLIKKKSVPQFDIEIYYEDGYYINVVENGQYNQLEFTDEKSLLLFVDSITNSPCAMVDYFWFYGYDRSDTSIFNETKITHTNNILSLVRLLKNMKHLKYGTPDEENDDSSTESDNNEEFEPRRTIVNDKVNIEDGWGEGDWGAASV